MSFDFRITQLVFDKPSLYLDLNEIVVQQHTDFTIRGIVGANAMDMTESQARVLVKKLEKALNE